MSVQNNNRLLSRTEVEQIYGVSKRFLENAAQRNEGPQRIMIGRLVRYRVGDICKWIESCAVGKTQSGGSS